MTCENAAAPLGLSWQNITVSSDGRAVSRGIGVGVGSPQQIVSLRPSIGDDNTWVFNAADCVSEKNSSCIGLKGGVYNSSRSHTFLQTTQAAWNGSQQANELASGSYIYFNDNFHFGSNGSSIGFPLLMDQPGQGSQSGLGIGPKSTFIDAAVKNWICSHKSLGLVADGALWIGGYDTSRIDGDFTDFPIFDKCSTCVQVTNITYINKNGSTSIFSNSSETLVVSLEPFQRSLNVPNDIFVNFMRASKGTVGVDPGTTGLLTFDPAADLGSLSVTLSNGYKTVIPSREFFLPPRQYNQNGEYSVSNNTYLVSGLANSSVTAPYVLNWGVPYLTMNYMIMDYDNKTFRMAAARQGPYGTSNGPLVQPLCKGIPVVTTTAVGTPGATAAAPASSTPPASSGKPSHTNVGAIAGGVVGGVVGLAIIAILAFFILRGRRREKALRRERDSVVASNIVNEQKNERISQYTATSPTEVSEFAAGEPDQKNINQWLYSQNKFSAEQPQVTATMKEPFEMPAGRHV